jgi:hypothetical protein
MGWGNTQGKSLNLPAQYKKGHAIPKKPATDLTAVTNPNTNPKLTWLKSPRRQRKLPHFRNPLSQMMTLMDQLLVQERSTSLHKVVVISSKLVDLKD